MQLEEWGRFLACVHWQPSLMSLQPLVLWLLFLTTPLATLCFGYLMYRGRQKLQVQILHSDSDHHLSACIWKDSHIVCSLCNHCNNQYIEPLLLPWLYYFLSFCLLFPLDFTPHKNQSFWKYTFLPLSILFTCQTETQLKVYKNTARVMKTQLGLTAILIPLSLYRHYTILKTPHIRYLFHWLRVNYQLLSTCPPQESQIIFLHFAKCI